MIKEYANLKGYYGAPKITKNLCAKGIKCSVSKVSRAMKTLGIRSIVAEKFVHRKSSMSEEEKSKIEYISSYIKEKNDSYYDMIKEIPKNLPYERKIYELMAEACPDKIKKFPSKYYNDKKIALHAE